MTCTRFAVASLSLLLGLSSCASTATAKKRPGVGSIVNRKQQGLWTYRYENGKLQAQGNYSQDRQVGRWTYFHPDGSKEWEVGFALEQFDGPTQWWWPSGKPEAYGVFCAGLEVGPFSYWNESGSLVKQGEYDDGLATSSWASWYDDGKPKAAGLQWKGQRVGPWEFWTEDGAAYKHEFPAPNGITPHREEWDDGTLRREGFVENGKPVGRWSTHHENGVRRASGRIVEGKPHGVWSLYRPDGTLLASVKFEHGTPARTLQVFEGMKSGNQSASALRLFDVEGIFSPADAAGGRPIAEVASTWISEAITALAPDAPREATSNAEPPESLLAELSTKALLPLHAQPWTESEELNMNYLVKLYTDGAPNAVAPGGGQYGGGPRGGRAAKKVSDGNTDRSSPLIGRKLGFAKAHTRDGKLLDLHTLEGKPLVLVILRGMAGEVCVYCYTQVRALCQTMPKFKAEGANVVVVYPGEADRLEAFWQALSKSEELEHREAPFVFAYDPGSELVSALSIEGNLALPTTLVIDASGTIRFAYVGAESADRPDAKRLLEKVKEVQQP
ncbi:MAG TPA: redoxin family protein [Planctomycetota bacterium]|nr:redoxin family protein [Planctomycetota bacterium]